MLCPRMAWHCCPRAVVRRSLPRLGECRAASSAPPASGWGGRVVRIVRRSAAPLPAPSRAPAPGARHRASAGRRARAVPGRGGHAQEARIASPRPSGGSPPRPAGIEEGPPSWSFAAGSAGSPPELRENSAMPFRAPGPVPHPPPPAQVVVRGRTRESCESRAEGRARALDSPHRDTRGRMARGA